MAGRAPLIPAIVGPTASGKTALALALGRMWQAEIVCCDSMQIYRGMDIGTAKPTPAERAALPHHCLDLCAPGEPFSAAAYASAATAAVADILRRGRLPLFCGGTGLYLDAVRYGRGDQIDDPPGETPLRASLLARANAPGGEDALYAALQTCDPETAAATHPHNVRRVIRALEIYYATGRPKSAWDAASRERPQRLQILPIGLLYQDRALLYARIDARVDAMLAAGLLEETRRLWETGVFETDSTAAQAIGYKELLPVLRGECTLSVAADQIRMATRRYAKRQMTWFRAMPDICWLTADRPDGSLRPLDDLCEEACAQYAAAAAACPAE